MSTPPPGLADAYRHCRRVTAAHGRSYHLATRLLPRAQRPHVHALYAFARAVDDLVDHPSPGAAPAGLSALLDSIAVAVDAALSAPPETAPRTLPGIDGRTSAAFLHTARTLRCDPGHFAAFLRSMRMDIPGTPEHVARYRTMAQLQEYMHGSAAVIGLQMLPVLGAGPEAAEPAAALGVAFQLTNFLRDVGEDLDRGRIYLPLDEFAAFGVDAERLAHARRTGEPDPDVRAALAHFVDVARGWYRRAAPGAALLDRRAGMCVRAAAAVYGGILDAVEDGGYRVFDRRATVPRARRALLAARAAADVRTPSPAPGAPPRGRDLPAARPPAAPAATGRR